MRVLRFLKTAAICTTFLGLFLVASATMIFCDSYPEGAPDNRIIRYLLKNIRVQSAAPDDYWATKYPYDTNTIQQYIDSLKERQQRIESFCTVSFPEADRVNRYANILKQRIYRYRLSEISNTHGNYIFVQDAADNAHEFAEYLHAKGIPVLYVQTPLLGTIKYYQGLEVEGKDLAYAERNAALCSLIEKTGIPLINVGKESTELFSYDVSNHWYPDHALKITRRIVGELNNNFGFSFHLADFDSASYVDCLEDYPLIKDQIQKNCGYSYSYPVPKQQHQYTVTHAEQEQWTGAFFDAISRPVEQWNTAEIAYHNSYRLNNTLMYEIVNHTALTNRERTILVIGDSFDWPICAYLAGGVGRLIIINNESFTGSMRSYVQAVSPDIVLIAYNDAQFFDEVYLEEAFYFE